MATSREEHLQWCKDRALIYCEQGDMKNALTSLLSDLSKHLETSNHPAIALGMQLFLGGHLATKDQMRDFINGTN